MLSQVAVRAKPRPTVADEIQAIAAKWKGSLKELPQVEEQQPEKTARKDGANIIAEDAGDVAGSSGMLVKCV